MKHKNSNFIKEIYFDGDFLPYNMIAFTDDIEEIKTKIIRWCKIHKKNVKLIKGFKSCGIFHKM